MIPEKLESMVKRSLEAKEVPFMVVLTAGTTVLGAFDPIESVSSICRKYNLWLHVDVSIYLTTKLCFYLKNIKLRF